MSKIIDNIVFDRKTVKWLFDLYSDNLLEVDNSYQRRFVWSKTNQIQLIETILLNYPIPEIYLLERGTNPENGETLYSIIDGQQRLTSVFGFINDEFRLDSKHIIEKNAQYENLLFSELSNEDRSNFWKYPFVVRMVNESISKEETVEMFLRLNRTSTTLNPQELRHAEFGGLFLRLAEELTELDFWEERNLFTGTDLRRMGDVQFVSQILIFFRFGFEEETSQSAINRAYDTFNESYDQIEEDRELFVAIIKKIDEILQQFEIEKFLKRKVHLYTLITYIYYLLTNDNTEIDNSLHRYGLFANNYSSDDDLQSIFEEKIDLVEEYKSLVLEGTQQRRNRIRRFQLIKELCE